jgi:hypothetical protein
LFVLWRVGVESGRGLLLISFPLSMSPCLSCHWSKHVYSIWFTH